MKSRWLALAILFTSVIQFTLNWFAVIPMFPYFTTEMGLGPIQVSGIVSAFLVGYGLMHIPGGIVAERYGMRFALIFGTALEGLGALATSMAHQYEWLLAARVLTGVGGSIYLGSAVGVTSAWFRDKELALANGMVTGVAFSVGASIALFGWGTLAEATGWREALAIGGGVSFASMLMLLIAYPTPPIPDIGTSEHHHSLESIRRVLTSKRLWLMSISFFGGYGGYFTAVAMLPGYVVETFAMPASKGHEISTVLLLSGIAGSFIGGWLADNGLGLLRTFLLGCLLEAGALIAVALVGPNSLSIVAAVLGGGHILGLVAWIGLPATMKDTFRPTDVPTAVGLMLTMSAAGGVALPPIYAELTQHLGAEAGWIGLGLFTAVFSGISLLTLRQPNRAPTMQRV